jgi:hypothetical protein
MAYIILFSKWTLAGDDSADDLNSALYIPQGSRVAGKTAKGSGLDGGKVQLNAFSRNHAPAVPFSVDVELQAGDVVYVTGEQFTLGTDAGTCTAHPGCTRSFLLWPG